MNTMIGTFTPGHARVDAGHQTPSNDNAIASGRTSDSVLVRAKRAQIEPKWQSNTQSWAQFQSRHYNWRMGLPPGTASTGARIPRTEGVSPKAPAKDVAFQILLAFIGGGPFNPVVGGRFAGAGSVAVVSRPTGGLRFDATFAGERPGVARPAGTLALQRGGASPQSPMDTTSPPRSNVQSPMDTTSPPRSNVQSPMDTASPPRSNVQSPMDTTPPLSEALPRQAAGAANETHPPALQDMYLNDQRMLEKKTFSTVYRAAPASERDAILQHGFLPSKHFGGVDKLISGDALIVSETADGARIFGDSEYGSGCYDLYEIDARGFKGVSLQDNVSFNARSIASRFGYTPEVLQSMQPREVAEGALEFREAHIDATAGDARRVKLIEYGTLPPQFSPNDATANSGSSGDSASDG
ncbi:hypothetical protein [Paraburkholderia rhizosphaerae]|uniref:Uncharacterized protein n=1 Tax=Paraburkholderia rhizosphaerae TaxID=480658 RepID=A0A4R8M3C6_9BURK|nr:hypothetical protein [Paraburkholderia rhizosphaerae]TDY54573.1 hypothetical protein BX592_10129 [Paraburkholderia rhizosphaerae]